MVITYSFKLSSIHDVHVNHDPIRQSRVCFLTKLTSNCITRHCSSNMNRDSVSTKPTTVQVAACQFHTFVQMCHFQLWKKKNQDNNIHDAKPKASKQWSTNHWLISERSEWLCSNSPSCGLRCIGGESRDVEIICGMCVNRAFYTNLTKDIYVTIKQQNYINIKNAWN